MEDATLLGRESEPATSRPRRLGYAVGAVAVVAAVAALSAWRAPAGAVAAPAAALNNDRRADDIQSVKTASTSASTSTDGTMLSKPTSNGTHPHIFVVLIDDQGYADMGYNNDLDVLSKCTPFMDQLAGDGIKLTQYYTQQLCTPARASLLTGKYPIHLGMQHDVIQPESPFGLPLGHQIMPAFLKDHYGYSTHMVGKVRARAAGARGGGQRERVV